MIPSFAILLRGEPADVLFDIDADCRLVWWPALPPDPPLSDYEARAIDALAANELRRLQQPWRDGHARRRARMAPGLRSGGDAA